MRVREFANVWRAHNYQQTGEEEDVDEEAVPRQPDSATTAMATALGEIILMPTRLALLVATFNFVVMICVTTLLTAQQGLC